MIGFGWMIAGIAALSGACTISGQVLDDSGQPTPGARVFVEPGLGGAVKEGIVRPDGTFRLEGLNDGPAGVFAFAPGRGFGGKHINLTLEDAVTGVSIVLSPGDEIRGQAVNSKGKPIPGARITRIGLLGESKVGIPLAKMKSLGFDSPVTDADGRFVVSNLPRSGSIALKVGHPDYAQEGVEGIAVGSADVKLTLTPGVVLEGLVQSRSKKVSIANAVVIVRNGQPPYDTAVAQSDGFGQFSMRLKPGAYLYQASFDDITSPGWTPVMLTGELPQTKITVYLVGSGNLRGSIKDAVSGQPVAGARISVDTNGNRAAIVYTGPTGEFHARVAEGETLLRMESAPGYLPPETGAIRVAVAEGQNVELPGMWLAPAPKYKIQVVGEDAQSPVPGAIITVLRPRQLGWYRTDAQGWADLTLVNLPADGRVVGMVETMTQSSGALFLLRREDAQGAKVQLLPFATIRGTTVSDKGLPLEGVVVGAVFPGESAQEDLLLWRCLSDKGGVFSWNRVVPGVPQICVARAGADADGESSPFNVKPGATQDIGALTISGGVSGKTLLGQSLRWYENKPIAGPCPDFKNLKKLSALVIYCSSAQADMVIAGLQSVEQTLGASPLTMAVVVSGAYSCPDTGVAVFNGPAVGQATTYLVDNDGIVCLETFGLPPAQSLAAFSVSKTS